MYSFNNRVEKFFFRRYLTVYYNTKDDIDFHLKRSSYLKRSRYEYNEFP